MKVPADRCLVRPPPGVPGMPSSCHLLWDSSLYLLSSLLSCLCFVLFFKAGFHYVAQAFDPPTSALFLLVGTLVPFIQAPLHGLITSPAFTS
jgi:hypothetical protein